MNFNAFFKKLIICFLKIQLKITPTTTIPNIIPKTIGLIVIQKIVIVFPKVIPITETSLATKSIANDIGIEGSVMTI